MDDIATLYSFSQDEKNSILKNFNRTTISVEEDIKIIEKWYQRQPHLPKLQLGDRRILSFLMISKFCIEKTKEKIENYFFIRKALPEFFIGKEPTNQAVKEFASRMCWTPLPTLIKGYSRVSILILQNDVLDLDPSFFIGHLLNMADYSLELEYALSQTAILDCNKVTLTNFAKMTTTIMKKGLAISEKVYKRKVEAVHLINCPPYIDTMITVVKSVIKEKVAARIHVHDTLDSLYEHIPKDILPKEYGGNEISVDEINGKFFKYLVGVDIKKLNGYTALVNPENLLDLANNLQYKIN